jgi:hypothetical protein
LKDLRLNSNSVTEKTVPASSSWSSYLATWHLSHLITHSITNQ